jgi:uncharacterized protein (DUF1778 family)
LEFYAAAVNKLGQAPSRPLIFQGFRRFGSEPVPFFTASSRDRGKTAHPPLGDPRLRGIIPQEGFGVQGFGNSDVVGLLGLQRNPIIKGENSEGLLDVYSSDELRPIQTSAAFHCSTDEVLLVTTSIQNDALAEFHLPGDLKAIVERAASHLGQTVGEFAAAALVRTAHEVIEQHERTLLSNRDRDIFLALLEDADAEPNEALRTAADQYRRQMC